MSLSTGIVLALHCPSLILFLPLHDNHMEAISQPIDRQSTNRKQSAHLSSCKDPSLKTDSWNFLSWFEARKGFPPHPKPASFRAGPPLKFMGKVGVMSSPTWGFSTGPLVLCTQMQWDIVPLHSALGLSHGFLDNGRAHLTSHYNQFNPSLMLGEDRGPSQWRR